MKEKLIEVFMLTKSNKSLNGQSIFATQLGHHYSQDISVHISVSSIIN